MSDPTTLSTVVSIAIGLTAMGLFLRALRGGDPVDLGAMFAHPWELEWPRGVQEEEPRPWRPERLTERDDVVSTADPAVPPAEPAARLRDDRWDAAA